MTRTTEHCLQARQNLTMKVKTNRKGLKLNGTHHLLVYTDDINLLDKNKIYESLVKTPVFI